MKAIYRGRFWPHTANLQKFQNTSLNRNVLKEFELWDILLKKNICSKVRWIHAVLPDCFLFKAASILSMCGIALDRYVHLVRNSRKRMSKERTLLVIAWCWLQSAVVATPWNKLTRLENIVNKGTLCLTIVTHSICFLSIW